jgi:hypothetical protein
LEVVAVGEESEITLAGPAAPVAPELGRPVVPLQIGSAVVYVERLGTVTVPADSAIRPVGEADPAQAFNVASDALAECVRQIGQRITQIAQNLRPDEVTTEFTLTFEAGGAFAIPLLVTAKGTTQTGIKVTATWNLGETKATDGSAQRG